MEQLGQGVIAALKEETGGFGVVPAVTTGYQKIRFNRGPGLSMAMADINPGEVRDDGQSANPRKGSKTVSGMLGGALYVAAWTQLLAAALRSTWVAGRLIQDAAIVDRSFTIEQYYKQLDGSKQFVGNRVAGFTFRLTPDNEGVLEFPFVGADMNILTGAAAPGYTSLLTNSAPALTSIDAAITIDGIPAVDLTAAEFTFDNRAAGLAVIGSRVTPNVWPNNATIRGRLTGTKKDFVREQKYLDESEFGLLFSFAEPAGGTGTFAITLPASKFIGFEEAIGDDGALLATIPFSAGTDLVGADRTMIAIDEAA